MTDRLHPQRGEIWYVDFNPIVGAEIAKIRPAVVVNPFGIGNLPLKIVVPLTHWDSRYTNMIWFVYVQKTLKNGLGKDSGANCFQVKSVSVKRFLNRIGKVSADELKNIVNAVALCIGA